MGSRIWRSVFLPCRCLLLSVCGISFREQYRPYPCRSRHGGLRCVVRLAHRNYWPNGVRNFPLTASVNATVLIIGALGLIGGGALGAEAGQPSNPRKFNSAAVFAAAPTSCKWNCPSMVAFSSLNAPPPYTMSTSLNVQPVHSTPSNWLVEPTMGPDSVMWRNGGTSGTAASTCMPPERFSWEGDDCAKLTVWFPSKDATIAPAIKDPSAKVIFDVTPPPSGNAASPQLAYGGRQGLQAGPPQRIRSSLGRDLKYGAAPLTAAGCAGRATETGRAVQIPGPIENQVPRAVAVPSVEAMQNGLGPVAATLVN